MGIQNAPLTWRRVATGYESMCGYYYLRRTPNRHFELHHLTAGRLHPGQVTLWQGKALAQDDADHRPSVAEQAAAEIEAAYDRACVCLPEIEAALPVPSDQEIERSYRDCPPVLVMPSTNQRTKAPKTPKAETVEEFAADELERQQVAERKANRKTYREARAKKKPRQAATVTEVPRGYGDFVALAKQYGWTVDQLGGDAPRPKGLAELAAAVGEVQLGEWAERALGEGELADSQGAVEVAPPADPQAVLDLLVRKHGDTVLRSREGVVLLTQAGLDKVDLTDAMWSLANRHNREWLKEQLKKHNEDPKRAFTCVVDGEAVPPPPASSHGGEEVDSGNENEGDTMKLAEKDVREMLTAAGRKNSGMDTERLNKLINNPDFVEKLLQRVGEDKLEGKNLETAQALIKANADEVKVRVKAAGRVDGKAKAKAAKTNPDKGKGVRKTKKSEGEPSNKEVIYKWWEKSKDKTTAKAEEYFEKVGQVVKLTTIRSWILAWNRGNNLPACAKK